MAVMTIIFTPLLTSVVVWFQLSKQHSYWQEEQSLLAQQKEFQTKLKVFTDVTGQINRINSIILTNQVYVLSRDTAIVLTRILKPLKHTEVDLYWKQFVEYKEKTQLGFLQLQEAKNSLHQTQALCGIVFGSQILQHFSAYFDKIKTLETPLVQASEIEEIIKKSLTENNNLERANSLVGVEFDKRYDSQKLNNAGATILEVISKIIVADYKDKTKLARYFMIQ